MNRYIWCFAATFLLGSSLRAGEMDSEFGGKSAPPTAGPQKAKLSAETATRATVMLTGAGEAKAAAWKASELDREQPSQSWGHWGGHHGWGGYRGFGWGGGFGRGFGWGGYGGFGGYGFGYRSFGLGFGGLGLGYGGFGYPYGGFGYGGYSLGYGSSFLYQSAFYPSYGYGYGGGFGCW